MKFTHNQGHIFNLGFAEKSAIVGGAVGGITRNIHCDAFCVSFAASFSVRNEINRRRQADRAGTFETLHHVNCIRTRASSSFFTVPLQPEVQHRLLISVRPPAYHRRGARARRNTIGHTSSFLVSRRSSRMKNWSMRAHFRCCFTQISHYRRTNAAFGCDRQNGTAAARVIRERNIELEMHKCAPATISHLCCFFTRCSCCGCNRPVGIHRYSRAIQFITYDFDC